VCLSVLGTWVSYAKMAGPIEMPFGETGARESKESCIRWGPDPPTGKGTLEGNIACPL